MGNIASLENKYFAKKQPIIFSLLLTLNDRLFCCLELITIKSEAFSQFITHNSSFYNSNADPQLSILHSAFSKKILSFYCSAFGVCTLCTTINSTNCVFVCYAFLCFFVCPVCFFCFCSTHIFPT